jgi:hypothetical protein
MRAMIVVMVGVLVHVAGISNVEHR